MYTLFFFYFIVDVLYLAFTFFSRSFLHAFYFVFSVIIIVFSVTPCFALSINLEIV